MDFKVTNLLYRFSNPGHVWSVRKGLFDHVGIETSVGTIISASPNTGGVAEISKTEFAGSQSPKHNGYPGNLPAWQVEARARTLIGKPYSVRTNNCEHLVTEVHGLKRTSPQLQFWVSVAVISLIGFAAFNIAKNKTA